MDAFAKFLFATLWITLKSEAATTPLTQVKDETGQILPYWVPKPQPERGRKNFQGNYVFHPINESKKKSGRKNPKHLQPVVMWSSHEENNIPSQKRDSMKAKKPIDYNTGYIGINSGVKFNPLRVKQVQKQEDGGEIRSTRIAPFHLMQQEKNQQQKEAKKLQEEVEQTKTNPPKGKKDDENIEDLVGDLVPLSAYSVQKQFTKLLENFEDKANFTSEVIGRTASYLDIVLFKISQRNNKYYLRAQDKYVENDKSEKKILFIVHALSPMGLGHLYSLTLESHLKMLIGYYIEHLDKFDIYLIPMANPDGYIKARTTTYWNKNVSPNTACPGVDVDRNFDVAWNITHTEMSSCNHHFPGLAPFSEPESRAVRDIFHRMSHKIVAYFHVHGGTYTKKTFKGDAVLYPKGFTDHQTDDDRYVDLKGEIDEAIKNANFKVLSVTVDTLFNWYGRVSGTSVDYAATVYGIPYAMEFVMQLYQDAFETNFQRIVKQGAFSLSSMEYHSLSEIWKRVINVTFTNIHNKLEAHEANVRLK